MKKILIPTLIAIVVIMTIILVTVLGNSSDNNNTNTVEDSNTTNLGSDISIKEEPNKIENITEEILRNYPETPVSDFEYREIRNNEAILIESYKGDNEIVVIPKEINGKPVVDIAALAFGNDSIVKAIMIPETVKEITKVFINNENLEIIIAEGLEIAGESMATLCTSLHTVILGDKLVKIEESSFGGCPKLTKLTIPATLTHMTVEEIYSSFSASKKLTIYGEKGSYIETVAKEYGISFVAE